MIISQAARLEEVKEYFFSKKLREIDDIQSRGEQVLNLAIGNPDLPPDSTVVSTLKQYACRADAHGYQSYIGISDLRNAYADWYKQMYKVIFDGSKEVLPLMGSKEGIAHISLAFINTGDEVLIPNPGYPAYASATKLAGGVPRYYNLYAEQNWHPDLTEIENSNDLSRVKIMWVNYPNMPTGITADESLFNQLIDFGYKHQILIVNDNPYSMILNSKPPMSIFQTPRSKAVCLELNSLSKSHNMAGWRLGMLVGDSAYIKSVIRVKSNMDSGQFLPIQRAAICALGLDEKWIDELNVLYAKRRKVVYQIMDALGCQYDTHAGGMFVWASIPTQYNSAIQLTDILLDKARIFVAPGVIFGSNGLRYIRISLCSPVSTFEKALKIIKDKRII